MVPDKGMDCQARAVGAALPARVGTSRTRWSGVVKIACSDLWSGSGPVVLVDDAAEDIATSDAAADRRYRTLDRLGELQAAMRSLVVVVADVLVEHRFEVSS
jgi:hypothetical protein